MHPKMTAKDKLQAVITANPDRPAASFPSFIASYAVEPTVLGTGNSATVYLGTHIPTGEKVALKVIDKKVIGFDDIRKIHREIAISKALRHPHVIRTYQTVENEEHVAVVMEYAPGGEMYTQLTKRGRYDEPEARSLFRQIVAAVSYCHSLHVVHRDLKTENVLLDAQGNIKLADFGFSDVMKPGECLEEWCGSPPYAAPELFQGHSYDGYKSDSWSLGVVLYVMVAGTLPFDGATLQETRERILAGFFELPAFISESCVSLLQAMLVIDPAKRCDLNSVMRHPWLYSDTADLRDLGNAWEPHYWLEDGLLGDNISVDDSEMNEFVLDEMEKLGHSREDVRHMVLTEPFHDVSATYHLLNDRFSRTLRDLPLPLIPIADQWSSRRSSSIITGIVAREEVTPSPTKIYGKDQSATTILRRTSLPLASTAQPTLFESWSWPSSSLYVTKSQPRESIRRRASDGAVTIPTKPLTFKQKSCDQSFHSVSDFSLSKEIEILCMDDSEEEPDMEAVQRYLSVRGKATRHTVTSGKRTGPLSQFLASPESRVLAPRRHSDNNPTMSALLGGRGRPRFQMTSYSNRSMSPMDEVTNLRRQLDSGIGSPFSYTLSPATLSPQRQSLCPGTSGNLLTVPCSCAETLPGRLDAAFRSPSFLDKLYGGIRIRVTDEDESFGVTGAE